MVSRSLGPEIGGVIGIAYYIAQALAVALNLVGFAEAITILTPIPVISTYWDPKARKQP
jgi:potassium/chloride transporter 9